MKMIYGTSNINKVKDIEAIIKANRENIEILTLKDIDFTDDIEENGKTFEENSEIKAIAIKKFCDKKGIKYDLITADDAGLCVECLNGQPGIHSARYAGEGATQEQILKKLLANISKTNDLERKAKFVCVLTSFLKNGTKIVTKGECKGKVATEYKKLGGLVYSPIFIPDGYTIPMADLPAEEYKKAHNHREKALRELIRQVTKNILLDKRQK